MRGGKALAVLAALALPALPGPAAGRVVDGVIAVVNDEPITFSEYRDLVSEGMGIPAGDADIHLREERRLDQILRGIETLVEPVLVRQELLRLGAPVSEAEIDRAVESVRKLNNLTEGEFAAALEKDGVTRQAYRRQVRWQMERGAIVRATKFKDVSVTDEEVRDYFRANAERFLAGAEIRIETLHVPLPPEADAAAAVRIRFAAQAAHERIRQGATFEEAAATAAKTVPGTAVLVSDFIRTDDLVPEIRKEANRLLSGETSGPFFTPSGGGIIRVVARRGGALPEFAAVKDALRDELVDRRSEKAYADVLADLKKAATIDVRF